MFSHNVGYMYDIVYGLVLPSVCHLFQMLHAYVVCYNVTYVCNKTMLQHNGNVTFSTVTFSNVTTI